jgi:hypothetical protein
MLAIIARCPDPQARTLVCLQTSSVRHRESIPGLHERIQPFRQWTYAIDVSDLSGSVESGHAVVATDFDVESSLKQAAETALTVSAVGFQKTVVVD